MEHPSQDVHVRSILTGLAVTFALGMGMDHAAFAEGPSGLCRYLSSRSGICENKLLPPVRITSLDMDFLASISQFEITSRAAAPIPWKPWAS